MPSTLLLDIAKWDLLLDANGNIAVAAAPYALAQDAASAIKTFLGEVYWDTTIGVRYMTQILGKNPPLPLLKQQLVMAALTVLGVVSAQVFINSLSDRLISGQVQVTDVDTGQVSVAPFTATNPQGIG